MAAGLGFKTFTTGEVLTAADTNGYLMQGVLVFASSAARAAAITSPQEGQYSYLKDTNSTEYYDGAAWIAAPIGDITGVTAGTGISGGGTSGTVTVTNSMATEIAAKGDLIVGTGAATFDNLTVGANGTTLVADSTASTGLKWAAPTLPNVVGCAAYSSATSFTYSSGAQTIVPLASELFDTNGFHSTSTNTSRVTIPSGYAGKYLLTAYMRIGGTANDYAIIVLYKNGAYYTNGLDNGAFSRTQPGGGTFALNGSTIVEGAVNDYFEIALQANSVSSPATMYAQLNMIYLGA
jgi:hypothetical protein